MNKSLLTLAIAAIVFAGATSQANAQAPAGVQAVDLGLPSGTKWASCNIGATAPEEYGNHYAWGETAPKEDYSWASYKYADGDSTKLTKYCNNAMWEYGEYYTDTEMTLEPEDDAATANWGEEWRMPTEEEWMELRDNCTFVWTRNGVRGSWVTSKTNGNSIFLPATGLYQGEKYSTAGQWGHYWSASILRYDNARQARRFNVAQDGVHWSSNDRCHGRSVRAVYGRTNVSTDIDNPSAEEAVPARKVLRNGQMLILRNGIYYDLHGRILSPNL